MPSTLTGIYRVEGNNPGGGRYRGMVAVVQTGDQFSFKWWIGTQTFEGTGQLAGRMLVINWGDKTPVVYTLGARDVLEGEWADGTATERLTLFGSASGNPVTLAEGSYRAAGRGANGAPYQGVVRIAREGDLYRLDWKIGKDEDKGRERSRAICSASTGAARRRSSTLSPPMAVSRVCGTPASARKR